MGTKQKEPELVSEAAPVVVASHPRSGTHLLIDLLRHQFEACRSWKWWGERLDRLYCSIDELNAERGRLNEPTAKRILRRTERPLVKTHAWPGYQEVFLEQHHDGLAPQWERWLRERATPLYVYRDGRDVMCSYQIFRRAFDPGSQGSVGAFMRGHDAGRAVNRVRQWRAHVQQWRAVEGAHAICFEHILERPEKTIQRIGALLDLDPDWRTPLLPERFSSIWHSRKARLFESRPESTAIIGEKSNDWTEQFASTDRAFFHDEAGDLLIELGYESSDEWASAP